MKEVNLIAYLPDIVGKTKEFEELIKAEEPEFILQWGSIGDTMNDQFVYDATENGVKRWEEILNITPKATETLDDRKFRIIARLNESTPYTIRILRHQLELLCGSDGYTVALYPNEYTLVVRIALTSKNKIDEVRKLLERVVPANIIRDLELMYNTHERLSSYTHEQLAVFTHEQLREKVFHA